TSMPAMDSCHTRMAWACGQRIVEMIWEDLHPARILTRNSFLNGIAAWMALGGSTNAAVHMPAMAGRAGIELSLDDFDEIARKVPVLANLFPSGNQLMEDFYYAGGLPALLNQISPHLALDALTCTGKTLGENISGHEVTDRDVIRPLN